MKELVQVKVEDKEFKKAHQSQLTSVVTKVEDIIPENSRFQGIIQGSDGQYEGRIHIKTRIGAFVAKAKARNLFSLIAKLESKIMRQVVNWREKKSC